MPNGFPDKDVAKLLADCHRRCCICHRFCGVKIETHHIKPKNDGGDNLIDNAIALCFECHAESQSYNPKHPRGRKFTTEELRIHKENWLHICRTQPEIFINAPRNTDVGPIQALIEELKFNELALALAESRDNDIPCALNDDQFRRAIKEGAFSVMDNGLQEKIMMAYSEIGRLNFELDALSKTTRGTNIWSPKAVLKVAPKAGSKIHDAKIALIEFLKSE